MKLTERDLRNVIKSALVIKESKQPKTVELTAEVNLDIAAINDKKVLRSKIKDKNLMISDTNDVIKITVALDPKKQQT